jgi:hypothetical protein
VTTTRELVDEHLDAFNSHDTERLKAGCSATVFWATGQDVFRGREALGGLFDDGLWALDPSLRVVRMVVDGDSAAVEMHEQLTVDGVVQAYDIAAFFTVADDLITTVRVYREGNAEIE